MEPGSQIVLQGVHVAAGSSERKHQFGFLDTVYVEVTGWFYRGLNVYEFRNYRLANGSLEAIAQPQLWLPRVMARGEREALLHSSNLTSSCVLFLVVVVLFGDFPCVRENYMNV